MSKKSQEQRRARYTLEFKFEAVRLVKAGQEASVTARVLGMPKLLRRTTTPLATLWADFCD